MNRHNNAKVTSTRHWPLAGDLQPDEIPPVRLLGHKPAQRKKGAYKRVLTRCSAGLLDRPCLGSEFRQWGFGTVVVVRERAAPLP